MLWATWDPDDTTVIGTVDVKKQDADVTTDDVVDVAKAVGNKTADVAKTVGSATVSAAKAVGRATQEVWDDITDNARLVNPTESRKLAERHLDAAEQTYDNIEDRLDDAQEAPLKPMRQHLEALEDAFEKDDAAWMTHYMAVIAALDALSPERPVGTSGGTVTLDATTRAQLGTMRLQLTSFHHAAMGK